MVYIRKQREPKELTLFKKTQNCSFTDLSGNDKIAVYKSLIKEQKHLENILTAFVQLVWFPQKFGVDKRSSHLSSMIVSGQMTRDEAMEQLSKPLYDEALMAEYKDVICKKIGISLEELEFYVHAQGHEHEEYKTDKASVVIRKLIGRFSK